jgi:hypothetical protein
MKPVRGAPGECNLWHVIRCEQAAACMTHQQSQTSLKGEPSLVSYWHARRNAHTSLGFYKPPPCTKHGRILNSYITNVFS